MPIRLGRFAVGALGALALLLLSHPVPAQADLAISSTATTMTVTATADPNPPIVQIEPASGDNWEIQLDSEVGITEAGSRCTGEGAGSSQVVCDIDGLVSLTLNGAAGADNRFILTFDEPIPITYNGGIEKDVVDDGSSLSEFGMFGDDNLNGGVLGDDELEGNGGEDTINGLADEDEIDGGSGDDIIDAGSQNDTEVSGGTGADTISGGDGNDVLEGEAGNDIVNGGNGNDTLDGGANAAAPQDTDVLNGDANKDELRNSEGADTFNGGANDAGPANGDTVTYALTAGSGGITADIGGSAGADGRSGEGDTLAADVENLTGDDGNDTLTGSSAANSLSGAAGDDTLRGGPGGGAADGGDTFTGGANGSAGDTVSYAGRTDSITGTIDASANDGAPGEFDVVGPTTENLIGGSGADTLSGNGDANSLDGAAGNDTLLGSAGTASDGADAFTGGPSTGSGDLVDYGARTGALDLTVGAPGASGSSGEGDTIAADIERVQSGAGNDDLIGDAAANELRGGDGNDTLLGGPGTGPDGSDKLVGQGDDDVATYALRTDPLNVLIAPIAFPGVEDIVDPSTEEVIGGSNNDVLIGFIGDFKLSGGPGDDTLKGSINSANDDGSDFFNGGPNGPLGDTVSYSGRTAPVVADIDLLAADDDGQAGEEDAISSTVENITGGFGDDTLTGDDGPNTLTGGNGADTLTSLGGVDRIEAIDSTFADIVNCGTEADSAGVDVGLDLVDASCEVLGEPPLPVPPGGNPPPGAPGATPKKKCGKKKKLKKGKCVKKKRKKGKK